MSPIVHGMVAWLVAVLFAKNVRDRRLITIAGVAMDIDGIFILFDRQAYYEMHHTFGHSVIFGILVALTVCVLAGDRIKASAGAIVAFTLHVVSDIAVTNWSVAVFSPFSDFRLYLYQDPAVVAVVYPAVFIVSFGMIVYIAWKKGISPLEFISENLDRRLVSMLFPKRESQDGEAP